MKVDLDEQMLLTSMELWRNVTDMKVPIADHLRVHLMANKATSLKNFIATATAWRTVLGSCTPVQDGAQQFAALMREVDAFIDWSKAGLVELQQLALQEAVTDGLDQLLQGFGEGSGPADPPPSPPEGEGGEQPKK